MTDLTLDETVHLALGAALALAVLVISTTLMEVLSAARARADYRLRMRVSRLDYRLRRESSPNDRGWMSVVLMPEERELVAYVGDHCLILWEEPVR